MRSVFALAFLASMVGVAEAGPFRLFRPRQRVSYQSGGPELSALESARISAATGVMAHRGGTYAFEGVGFSTVSPDAALANCCYWGTKTVVESAVVEGSRGWFACVRYR